MTMKIIVSFAMATAILAVVAACSASTAPDRCIAVDAGEGRYQHSPKYEICIPDKAVYSRPDVADNRINVVNAYGGTWLPTGVYEISVYRDAISTQTIEKDQEVFIQMGMRKIVSGSQNIYYRQKNRILNKLPEEAKKMSFGISIAEARGDGKLVFIEAAIIKPKSFEKDPVGAMDELVRVNIHNLLNNLKILSSPATQPNQ